MRFGCNKEIEVAIPTRYSYKMVKARCGTTSYTGGINQCDECAKKYTYLPPDEDEGDMEWYERNALNDEEDYNDYGCP